MIGRLFRFSKSCCRVYAHLVVNALFPLSLCWSINMMELAFSYYYLQDIVIHLGFALIPLYIWRLIYFVFMRRESRLFMFRNLNSNNVSFFGLICATVTVVSIVRDLFLLHNQSLDIIPAGIVGKYLEYLFEPDLLSWSNLSFWLFLRYAVIIISLYPYIGSLYNIFHLSATTKYNDYNHIGTDNWNSKKKSLSFDDKDKAKTTKKKRKQGIFGGSRRKLGRKITYIE